MKQTLFVFLVAMVCMVAVGCNPQTDGNTLDGTATIYADFSFASTDPPPIEQMQTFPLPYTGELSAATLAQGLSDVSGLDFLVSVQRSDTSIIVDWQSDSTLFTGLMGRTPKSGFTFDSDNVMRWFMLDSMYQTLRKNMGIDEIYYTMNGGKSLMLEDLAPVKRFPTDAAFKGSNFYRVYATANGDAAAITSVNDAALCLMETITLEEGQVVVNKGQITYMGEKSWQFAVGVNKAGGFQGSAYYAVGASGEVYPLESLQGAQEKEAAAAAEKSAMTEDMRNMLEQVSMALYGGLQGAPVLVGESETSLLYSFTGATGETGTIAFGRDPNRTIDRQMQLVLPGDPSTIYEIGFGNTVYLTSETGYILTAEEFKAARAGLANQDPK